MVRAARAWVWVLALLALGLQVDAVVKSTVMTAAPMAAMAVMPMCDGGAVAGMAMGAGKTAPHPPGKSAPNCPYCAAALHAPLVATTPPLPVCAEASFAAYPSVAWHGPRGPPARRPRARDPPILA